MATKIFITDGRTDTADTLYNVILTDPDAIQDVLDITDTGTKTNNTIYRGKGEPSSSLGIDGNIYMDEDSSDVYIKQNGEWNKIDVPGPGPTPPPTDLPDSFLPLLGSLSEEIGGVIE